jgi:hypothetical protein
MPREVVDALKKQGRWQEGGGECEFRFNPARDSDLMSAAVPI